MKTARAIALLACAAALLSSCSRSRFACSWPVEAPRITQDYGCYACTFPEKYHSGIDMTSALEPAGSLSARVFAAADGIVVLAHGTCPAEGEPLCGGGLGNHLLIGHDNGYASLYAHLDRLRVRPGERVARGGVIGTMGSSGNASGVHLHFDLISFTPANAGGIGPRYTDNYPEENGHLDPKECVRHMVVEISGETVPVLERPASYHIPSPDIITTVAKGERFVALAESSSWHYLSLPSASGPAVPPWSPGAVYGWVQGEREVAAEGSVLCAARNRGRGSIPVYAGQGATLSALTRIWEGQHYLFRTETGAPDARCGDNQWYRIDLPASAGAREGWVNGEQLRAVK